MIGAYIILNHKTTYLRWDVLQMAGAHNLPFIRLLVVVDTFCGLISEKQFLSLIVYGVLSAWNKRAFFPHDMLHQLSFKYFLKLHKVKKL